MDFNKFNADLNREQKELQKLEKIQQRRPADRPSIVSFVERSSFLINSVHTGIICYWPKNLNELPRS